MKIRKREYQNHPPTENTTEILFGSMSSEKDKESYGDNKKPAFHQLTRPTELSEKEKTKRVNFTKKITKLVERLKIDSDLIML